MRTKVVFRSDEQVLSTNFGEVTTIHDTIKGATFYPTVSEDGIISWTNDQDLPNPQAVNIKGEDGFSPRLVVNPIQDGYEIVVTNKEGSDTYKIVTPSLKIEDEVNALENVVEILAENVDDINTQVSTLDAKVIQIDNQLIEYINENTTNIDTISSRLDDFDRDLTLITAIIPQITENSNSLTDIKQVVIPTIQADLLTEIARAKAEEEKLSVAINTLTETFDRDIATTALDAVNNTIAAVSSDDGIDNINLLVEHVNSNRESIGEMRLAVDANTEQINKLANVFESVDTEGELPTITEIIQQELESGDYGLGPATSDTLGAVKPSSEFAVADDGTLSIEQVNISKLSQNEGDILTLDGGEMIA